MRWIGVMLAGALSIGALPSSASAAAGPTEENALAAEQEVASALLANDADGSRGRRAPVLAAGCLPIRDWLHLTQPGVSRQIKALEEELGVVLLARGKRSVALTPEGEIFYEEAQDLLAHIDRVVRRVQSNQSREVLRVGYAPSLVSDLLPKAIAHFKVLQRNVRVELVDMTPKEICERAAKGLIDVAIIPRGVESRLRGVELIEITRLDPVLVVPKGHRLARLSKIPPRILQNVPLYGLGRRDFPEYAPRLRAILKPFGVVPVLVSQTSDGAASLFAKMIADNGAAVLTEGVVDSLPAPLVARPFRPALPPLVILAALFVSRPSLNAEGFARQLKEEAERRKKPRVH